MFIFYKPLKLYRMKKIIIGSAIVVFIGAAAFRPSPRYTVPNHPVINDTVPGQDDTSGNSLDTTVPEDKNRINNDTNNNFNNNNNNFAPPATPPTPNPNPTFPQNPNPPGSNPTINPPATNPVLPPSNPTINPPATNPASPGTTIPH
jgi:hypothetical protein